MGGKARVTWGNRCRTVLITRTRTDVTTMAAALLVLTVLALAVVLLAGGPTALPRRVTTDDRRRQAPPDEFEIAVTDHRGDVDDGTGSSLGTWLTAGGVLLAAVIAALVGERI